MEDVWLYPFVIMFASVNKITLVLLKTLKIILSGVGSHIVIFLRENVDLHHSLNDICARVDHNLDKKIIDPTV